MASARPVIGLTCGDPAGVGPEVIERALASGKLGDDFEYRIIGAGDGFRRGQPSRESAQAALEALELSSRLALAGEIAAVVTGPIHKKRMQEVGFEFPGQTEFFATRWKTPDFAMCLTGGKLTVALVTAHVPLKDVAGMLSSAEIVRVGKLLQGFLWRVLGRVPKIGVAGLNPHAGEEGLMGHEEIQIIAPAVAQLKGLNQTEEGKSAEWSGPFSPDTLFYRAVQGEFDGVLCMYHDQGLIPLKLHAFHDGVNVTLGLPVPRTSPDHGTAFEIAGKGLARADSMIAAVRLAGQMIKQ